jgi:NADPH:quinone reductase-like Zn-dependent oxidoreductase
VNACGSAIGRIFAQLAAIFGYRLLAVTRNGAHTAELKELGAAEVIDTSIEPVREAVLAATQGRGAMAAIDSIGGADGIALAGCVRPGGTVLSIGLLSGVPVDWGEVARTCKLGARLFWLRHWVQQVTNRQWRETFEQLADLAEHGRLRLAGIGGSYSLQHVKDAVLAAEAPGRRGKIVLAGETT